jgi:hypothetical protein
MLRKYWWTFLAVFVAVGCGPSGNYTRSIHGTEGGYSLANAEPTPASLMIARKIERPLYIVLDADRVKDSWTMETSPCATGSDQCKRFELMDVHTFVRRDLKAAMENYFSRVEVVESQAALPSTPHVVADVKIDNIRLNDLVRGGFTYTLIEMTWGFAIRRSEQQDYAYSFAGTAVSNDSYPTFEAGCATLIENAIPGMLKKWTEEGGVEALRDADSKAVGTDQEADLVGGR